MGILYNLNIFKTCKDSIFQKKNSFVNFLKLRQI